MTTHDQIEQHRRFWRGEGPCLILLPAANMAQYDTAGYRSRFDDPQLMWEAEVRRGIFKSAAMRWPGSAWDPWNWRVAEELMDLFMTLDSTIP